MCAFKYERIITKEDFGKKKIESKFSCRRYSDIVIKYSFPYKFLTVLINGKGDCNLIRRISVIKSNSAQIKLYLAFNIFNPRCQIH